MHTLYVQRPPSPHRRRKQEIDAFFYVFLAGCKEQDIYLCRTLIMSGGDDSIYCFGHVLLLSFVPQIGCLHGKHNMVELAPQQEERDVIMMLLLSSGWTWILPTTNWYTLSLQRSTRNH